jgi:hypothetical protein
MPIHGLTGSGARPNGRTERTSRISLHQELTAGYVGRAPPDRIASEDTQTTRLPRARSIRDPAKPAPMSLQGATDSLSLGGAQRSPGLTRGSMPQGGSTACATT